MRAQPYEMSPRGPEAEARAYTLGDLLTEDVAPVRRFEDRQIVEEHYLEEMRRAGRLADQADRVCDDVRRRLKQLRAQSDATEHRLRAAEEGVNGYKMRLHDAKAATARTRQAVAAKRAMAADQSRPKMSAEEEVDVDALRYAVETQERAVLLLRQRHVDSHQAAKDLDADVERLNVMLQRAEARRAELEEARAQLTAAEAHPSHGDAAAAEDEFAALGAKLRTQEAAIADTRLEKQSMLMHLLDGLKTRSAEIERHRRRLGDQSLTRGQCTQEAHENLSRRIAESVVKRAELCNVLVNAGAEREAMDQLCGVLSERCRALMVELREREALRFAKR